MADVNELLWLFFCKKPQQTIYEVSSIIGRNHMFVLRNLAICHKAPPATCIIVTSPAVPSPYTLQQTAQY
jgi:hypothetical protein